MTTARLVLEDGSVYTGQNTGAPGTTLGEIVFNTCMTGYQEILTDPSYTGQMVVMTAPEIGNYGVNTEDIESSGASVSVSGFITRKLSPVASNWRANGTLGDYLTHNNVTGICGVDTRAITRRIRTAGAMKAGITTDAVLTTEAFLEKIRSQPRLSDQDLVAKVSCRTPYTLTQDKTSSHTVDKLVVIDFGIKQGILRYLKGLVTELVVLPHNATLEDVLAQNAQGVLLSNGPGDPENCPSAIALVQQLMARRIPTFGICLGHQIISLACGAVVAKMPFGHHGGNHPVKDTLTNTIAITSQNHGFAIMPVDFPDDVLEVTHINLFDGTIAGVRHKTLPVASVQFHPEASPGPHDSAYLFTRFMQGVLSGQPVLA